LIKFFHFSVGFSQIVFVEIFADQKGEQSHRTFGVQHPDFVRVLKHFDSVNFVQFYVSEERLYDRVAERLFEKVPHVHFDRIFPNVCLRILHLIQRLIENV
jgi:hypothetical protein